MDIKNRLVTLGIKLPRPPTPVANFRTAVRTGNLVYLSGQGPSDDEGKPISGKVGATYTAEQAQAFARVVGLNLLAVLEAELGDLDRVTRVVKLLGMVNAVPDFTRHSFVIDGCSNLFGDVFPDLGQHARSAVGMSSLPYDIPVEIEAIFEIRD